MNDYFILFEVGQSTFFQKLNSLCLVTCNIVHLSSFSTRLLSNFGLINCVFEKTPILFSPQNRLAVFFFFFFLSLDIWNFDFQYKSTMQDINQIIYRYVIKTGVKMH